MEIKEEGTSEEGQHFLPAAQANDSEDIQFTSIQKIPSEPQLEFILACKDLVAPVSDRKLNTVVQISVIHPVERTLTRYSSTEIVEGTKDPLFLTGVTFPSEYPIYEETRIKLTVYDVKDKSHDTVVMLLRDTEKRAYQPSPPSTCDKVKVYVFLGQQNGGILIAKSEA
nr:type II inositol 3,4-bisphosphate 4-phosphatase-like [Meriones unguiculatus]